MLFVKHSVKNASTKASVEFKNGGVLGLGTTEQYSEQIQGAQFKKYTAALHPLKYFTWFLYQYTQPYLPK
jgi:hypothetical protein